MKTSKIKSGMIATMLAAISVTGSVNPAIANPNAPPVLTVEKAAIAKDLANITASRDHISMLQQKQHDERKAGINTNATNKELQKARADCSHAKAYLRADKRDMVSDHQAYVAERKKAVRDDRMSMIRSRFKVEGDLTAGRSSAIDKTKVIISDKQQLKDDKLALKQAKSNRNSDVLLENDKIDEAKGQGHALLKIEDAGVRMQNLAMK